MTKARSNATANAAKGDLTVGNGTNLSGILAVGSNGDTIVADSSTATGLRYQGSMAAGRNFAINGGFDMWQRGTSFSVAANSFGYYADRWMADTGPNQASTFSRQTTGDTTNLPSIQYCFRFQRNSGQTGTGVQALITSLETVNSIPLAGKTVTLSFYARAGANYSAASNALVFRLLTGTGTDQNALTVGYTGQANTINETATLTTTWQRFTATATVPSTTTEAAVYFRYTPTGTAGAADYYEITGIQLEVGSVATQFSRAGGTIQGETSACQRYYYKVVQGSNLTISMCSAEATNTPLTLINFPVTMRSTTTLEQVTGTNYYGVRSAGTGTAQFNSFTLDYGSTYGAVIYATGTITAGYAGRFLTQNASSSIAFSAEL